MLFWPRFRHVYSTSMIFGNFVQITVEIVYFRTRATRSAPRLLSVNSFVFAVAVAKIDQTFPSAVWSLCLLVELQHVTVFFSAA